MVELLSPAGNMECFLAAVSAGADAVYLGLKQFGARANADNFDEDELLKAIDIAHIHGVKVYLTVNTLFKDSEYEPLFDALVEPYLHGLDGVIVQDIGVVSFISSHFPKLNIHSSTQMAITDVAGAMLVKNLGITRVVPARELSLEEIKRMKTQAGVEVECFIHGAMCYSYSGKCLFSSFLGSRSGNRGRCAQPCRLPYDDYYYLSMKDMCTLDIIPELIEAGIDSFKIEGRMKNSDYVYAVTSIYRKYIDLYESGKSYKVSTEDKQLILSRYTRSGNTKGYYFNKNGRKMITIDSPAYSSNAQEDSLMQLNKEPAKIGISMKCVVKADEPMVLSLYIIDKHSIYYGREYIYTSDVLGQKAKKAPLSAEYVKKQFVKTGQTFFDVAECEVHVEDNVFASASMINSVRRNAIEGLQNELLGCSRREHNDVVYGNDINNNICNEKRKKNDNIRVKVQIINSVQLNAVLEHSVITDVIIPLYSFLKTVKECNQVVLKERIGSGLGIYIQLPYIIRDTVKCISQDQLIKEINEVDDYLDMHINVKIKGYYVSNYEELYLLKENDYSGIIIGDIHMYGYSDTASKANQSIGIDVATVPVELTESELKRRNVKNEELIVYGHMPMMISTQCVMCTKEGCRYNDNGHDIYIKDRKGLRMHVYCNCKECTNVIYNSVPVSIAGKRDFIESISPTAVRMIFTDESFNEVSDILNKFVNIWYNIDGTDNTEVCDVYTRGHLTRGVD